MRSLFRHLRGNAPLAGGIGLLLLLLLFCTAGRLLVDVDQAQPLSAPPSLSPSWQYPFGTDDSGRNLFAAVVMGVGLTGWIGLVAGFVGLGIGALLGFVAGYVGGKTDTVIRGFADTLLTIPGLLVLVSVASVIREEISLTVMALVVSALAWMWPTRTIRAQVLSMRERGYVQMARLNGLNTAEIIAGELFPNLLPYLAASFVSAVSSAILATVYLEALGLGPQNEPTLGMTLYWAISFSALINGRWWWWAIPTGFLVLLFVAQYLVAAGLDRVANPQQRTGT